MGGALTSNWDAVCRGWAGVRTRGKEGYSLREHSLVAGTNMDGSKVSEMKDTEMAITDSEGDDMKEIFRSKMSKEFKALCDRGQPVNEAAALALRIACGTVASPPPLPLLLSTLASARAAPSPATLAHLSSLISSVFSVPDLLAVTFLLPPTTPKDPSPLGLDLESLTIFYEGVVKLEVEEVSEALMQAMSASVEYLGARKSVEASLLQPVVAMLLNPLLLEPEHHGVLALLCSLLSSPGTDTRGVGEHLDVLRALDFTRMLSIVHHFITITLFETNDATPPLQAATRLLHMLYDSNSRVRRVPLSSFYNDAVNSDDFNLRDEYQKWAMNARGASTFTFLSHPFVFDPASKTRVLRMDSSAQMTAHFEEALLTAFLSDSVAPFYVLRVRRDHLIADAIAQMQRRQGDVKKPLKVQFVGEEGIDEGGVQKEFFQLLFREILDPVYGMFAYDEDTRLFWFNAHSSSTADMGAEYELVGMMTGLAVYNAHILDFRFPPVLYKKLLQQAVGMEELAGVKPEVARGLEEVMRFEGDVESTYGLTFQVEVADMFGSIHLHELKEGGGDIPVTAVNRAEYVALCISFHLTTSIASSFDSFSRGFHRVCGGPVMRMFEAEELELLICGSSVLDFEALEKGTRYEDGYTAGSGYMRQFWKVVHSFSEEQKKRLLFFVTGSDRVPIKGLADLVFVISRNGSDSDRLPTSHTCFNHLLLPEYSSEEKMQDRLIMAINNAEGFGLM